MKHLFLIHSHITYYLAKSVEDSLNLDQNDIVYIFARNYSNVNSGEIKSVPLGHIPYQQNVHFKNFISFWKHTSAIDKLINNLVEGENFNAYLPHFSDPIMQMIGTHSHCVQVNFIEEGTLQYSKKTYLKQPYKNLNNFIEYNLDRFLTYVKLFGKGRFFRVNNFYDFTFLNKEIGHFYCLSESCFIPFLKKRVIIPLFKEEIDIQFQAINNLMVFEAMIENDVVNEKNFFDILNTILDSISSSVLHLKFHPAQTIESRTLIENLFKKRDISYLVVPDYVPVEQILASDRKIRVIGFASSILLYAKILKHEVISFDQELQALDSKYQVYRRYNDFDLF